MSFATGANWLPSVCRRMLHSGLVWVRSRPVRPTPPGCCAYKPSQPGRLGLTPTRTGPPSERTANLRVMCSSSTEERSYVSEHPETRAAGAVGPSTAASETDAWASLQPGTGALGLQRARCQATPAASRSDGARDLSEPLRRKRAAPLRRPRAAPGPRGRSGCGCSTCPGTHPS
jgi:hypothetical protein